MVNKEMNNVHFCAEDDIGMQMKTEGTNDRRQEALSAKSAETRQRILAAADDLMNETGIEAVQIRSVTSRAGCSIGSVYKHFKDNDALIVAVNVLTLERLKAAMADVAKGVEEPIERLKALSHAYRQFAQENTKAWQGLFSHHLPDGQGIPEEHLGLNVALLELIAGTLREINPHLSHEVLAARTRTCFAAIHGLVTISLEGRFVAVDDQSLASEMDFMVDRLSVAP